MCVATGSTGTTRKSNPEADLPRPTRLLNLMSTRASQPTTTNSSDIAATGDIPPPTIPTICQDTGVAIPKYLRATNTQAPQDQQMQTVSGL